MKTWTTLLMLGFSLPVLSSVGAKSETRYQIQCRVKDNIYKGKIFQTENGIISRGWLTVEYNLYAIHVQVGYGSTSKNLDPTWKTQLFVEFYQKEMKKRIRLAVVRGITSDEIRRQPVEVGSFYFSPVAGRIDYSCGIVWVP